MKKEFKITSGVFNIVIILATCFLPTVYFSYYNFIWKRFIHSTYSLLGIIFDNEFYENTILGITVAIALVLMLVSAILLFLNKKEKISSIFQMVATILLILSYGVIGIGATGTHILTTYADASTYSLEITGYIVLILCIVNFIFSILSFKNLKDIK